MLLACLLVAVANGTNPMASAVVTCSVADHVVVSSAHATKDLSASIEMLTLCVVTSTVAVTLQVRV